VVTGNTPNSCAAGPIPPQWSWHHRLLSSLRDHLIATAGAGEGPDARARSGAGRLNRTERAQFLRLRRKLAQVEERLFEVDCALQRIYDDGYGTCEETGRPIPAQRLRAMPWTRTAA
jgi:RNA polymerase-binding transcription factor DksA